MRDFAEIDRMLDELGPVPNDVAALVARVLGTDPSAGALEAALQALGAEPAVASPLRVVTPLPAAPQRASSDRPSHDTMEEWPPESLPAAPPAEELESATEDLLGASAPPPAYTFSDAPLVAAAEEDEPELSLGAPSDVPPGDTEPPDTEPPLSTRALLDRELDPSEFPSRPPQRVETPPPPAVAATADDEDFEMLIEDEEILEIQEDDVETDEGDAG